MRNEKSCGVIVFTRIDNSIKYVIIKSINGVYGFPKGHVIDGESEAQTALREVYEEVGLKPLLLKDFRETVEYYIPSVDVQKLVVYFVGEYNNQEIVHQESELISAELMSYDEAMAIFTHENNKELLSKADKFIKGL